MRGTRRRPAARRIPVAVVIPVALVVEWSAPLTTRYDGGQREDSCRVSLMPETLRTRAGPSRVLAEFGAALPDTEQVHLPPASGLRLLHAERGAARPVVVLTISTWNARAGSWSVRFGSRQGRCAAELEVEDTTAPARGRRTERTMSPHPQESISHHSGGGP